MISLAASSDGLSGTIQVGGVDSLTLRNNGAALELEHPVGTKCMTVDAAGFVALAGSPSVKQVMFTGTTSATADTTVYHSLAGITSPSKVVGINLVVNTGASMASMGDTAAVAIGFIDIVGNRAGVVGKASGVPTTNKPYTLIITYIP